MKAESLRLISQERMVCIRTELHYFKAKGQLCDEVMDDKRILGTVEEKGMDKSEWDLENRAVDLTLMDHTRRILRIET